MALRFAFALCGMRLRASGNAQLLGVCARSQKELNERVEMLLSLDMFRFWDHRELSHFMMVATNATRQRGSLLVRQVSPPSAAATFRSAFGAVCCAFACRVPVRRSAASLRHCCGMRRSWRAGEWAVRVARCIAP